MIAKTPKPPYYAVVFTLLSSVDQDYLDMSSRMLNLASDQPGFLGIETARDKLGITVSYWSDLESIKSWKANLDHQEAQRLGKEKWYLEYKVRIAKVERDYEY